MDRVRILIGDKDREGGLEPEHFEVWSSPCGMPGFAFGHGGGGQGTEARSYQAQGVERARKSTNVNFISFLFPIESC